MRGEKRKLIAIVMTIALVLAGSSFVPKQAKAADSGTVTQSETWVGGTAWQIKTNVLNGTYTGANSQVGFAYSPVYSGNWPPMHRLQAMQSFTTGTTYNYTIKLRMSGGGIGADNIWLSDGTLNTPTAGGSADKSKAIATISNDVSAGGDVVFTGTWTPTASDPHLFVVIYWPGADLTFTVTQFDVTQVTGPITTTTTAAPTTDAGGYYAAVSNGSWQTIGSNGFMYKLKSGMSGSKYKGGTSTTDPFDIKIGTYVGADHDFETKSPVFTVVAGHSYKLTYNVNNIGTKDIGATVYATVTDADNDSSDITSNYNNKIAVAAGTDEDIVLTYTAPASGKVYFKCNMSWTPDSEFVLTPTNEDTTPTTTADPSLNNCTLGAWSFADDPGTSGWQYFVHASSTGSTYKGGTGMNDPLYINYGAYVEGADYSCMARSPITTVTSGNSCTGTISITSSENIGEAGAKVVGASVYAYNSSTGEYTWLASASEEDTNVVADTKTTFNLSYTAPETGKVVYVLTTSYTPVATLKFEATHSEQTPAPTTTTAAPTTTAEPGYSACTLGDWTFADAPGTSGWQYFVHANSTGSTYKGGTGMNDPLFIKYGTYVPDADYSCMARSPITTVTSGNSCTGTISITSSQNIGQSGDQIVGASVYAYNSNSGEYTWLANATEASTNVVADTKTTFNLSYTAPDTGYVVYILTTSYTPVATLKFEATHSEQTAAPTTTTAAPTTTADGWIDVPDATATTVGAWTLFANYAEWAQLQYKNNVTTPSTMADTSIRVKNPTGWYNWNCTAKLAGFLAGKMTAGQSYKITINVISSKATAPVSTIKVAIDNVIYYFELDAGNNALTIDGFTYVGDNNDVTFDLSLLQAGTELTFSSITFEGNTDPSTTEETTQAPQPVVDPDIDLTGYQINTSSEGFRMVGQVEPTINGQSVTEFGFVYGLSKIYKPSTDSYQDTGITNDDMEVGVDNKYVVSYATTSDGIIENKMAHSTTAIYFARTMTFGKKNKAAFASKYKVRVYAKLANNQYVYSDVSDFAVFDIAEALYQGCLMNNLANHEYLYNTILTKVDENYEEVPYEYSHKIADPGEINS